MYQQGRLDGLCGIYAAINSARYIVRGQRKRLTHEQARQIFAEACRELTEERKLLEVVTDGMEVARMARVLRKAHQVVEKIVGPRIVFQRAFARHIPLAEYIDRLSDHIENHGPASVIFGMTGRFDHWTCLASVSRRDLRLIDSDRLQRLRRDRCTTGNPTVARDQKLWPTQTFLLRADH